MRGLVIILFFTVSSSCSFSQSEGYLGQSWNIQLGGVSSLGDGFNPALSVEKVINRKQTLGFMIKYSTLENSSTLFQSSWNEENQSFESNTSGISGLSDRYSLKLSWQFYKSLAPLNRFVDLAFGIDVIKHQVPSDVVFNQFESYYNLKTKVAPSLSLGIGNNWFLSKNVFLGFGANYGLHVLLDDQSERYMINSDDVLRIQSNFRDSLMFSEFLGFSLNLGVSI